MNVKIIFDAVDIIDGIKDSFSVHVSMEEDVFSARVVNLEPSPEMLNGKADAIINTASGEIASFPDGADGVPMKSLVVSIQPIQSGSGDPAPSNVRPISGLTGLSVYRTGKNMYGGVLNQYTSNNVTTDVVSLSAGTYTFSCDYASTFGGIYIRNGATISSPVLAQAYNTTKITFTLAEDYASVMIQLYKGGGVSVSEVSHPQLELGSTATTYEPYNGNTYAVDWSAQAGTVYGGTVDVVTGQLTVDRVSVNINPAAKYENANGYFWYTTATAMGIGAISGLNAGLLCNRLAAIGNITETSAEGKIAFFANGIIRWKEQGSLSLADYRTYLASNPLQIVYELATPITYQLSAQEVETLKGQNNVWSDAGDVDLTYVADTKLYIDNKIAQAIAAALNA